MIGAGSLEFAYARIWARHGARPGEAVWQHIEVTRELAAVLDIARASALGRWLDGMEPGADAHGIELAMLRHWCERVDEVASWMPAPWHRAIVWCAVLVDLPALQHLARAAPPLPWMDRDPLLRAIVGAGPTAADPARALLDAAREQPQQVWPLWLAHWRRCLPRAGAGSAAHARLVALLQEHAAAFGAPQVADGWALRRALQRRLTMLLRRALVDPATAFIYLALSALEFERLRGELLRRVAFPHRSPAA